MAVPREERWGGSDGPLVRSLDGLRPMPLPTSELQSQHFVDLIGTSLQRVGYCMTSKPSREH